MGGRVKELHGPARLCNGIDRKSAHHQPHTSSFALELSEDGPRTCGACKTLARPLEGLSRTGLRSGMCHPQASTGHILPTNT